MNRLQPPPAHLVPRVLLLCLLYALLLLWTGGGSAADALSMAGGTLQISPEGASALHLLLPRAVRSFFLMLLALAMGLSFALAATLLLSMLGARALWLTGWVGRLMAGVPPMGWAMGGLFLFLRVWNLPVETLFPHQTPPELDSWTMQAGRATWGWLAPAITLALPVFGSAFFSLTHRLSALLQSPGQMTLTARGLGQGWIVHRHFAPLLGVQMARLARPAAAVLLCFVIPVEEIFGFDGWGHFVARRLAADTPQAPALATAMWVGAWMLAGLLVIAGWPDRRGLPPSLEEINDHGQRRSLLSAGLGGALMLVLLVLPHSAAGSTTVWSQLMASHALGLQEVPRALGAALGALVLVVLGVPLLLPSLRSRWLADGGIIASWGIAPLFLMVLLWEQVHAQSWLAVIVALAAPGLVSLRAFFLDETRSGVIEASRSIGESTFGLCYRHLLRLAQPGLLHWALRTAGLALILFSVLDFYAAGLRNGGTSTWGALMRIHHDDLLEHPALALGPALWIALWSLSFRLLSRAFRSETPRAPHSNLRPVMESPPPPATTAPLLKIRGLNISFQRRGSEPLHAVKNLSLDLAQGESMAIVGESGSGKSVTALSLARLLPEPQAKIEATEFQVNGRDVLKMSERELRKIRGKEIAYVFQEPATSLNPVLTIRTQMAEALRLHRPEVKKLDAEITQWLYKVGIVEPEKRLRAYPHELSGGMQQRVMIAMALCCQPKLLIADEPTTALDVTIQKQIIDLLGELKSSLNMSIVLITHNFAIIRGIADKVAVMFRGEIVEAGPTEKVLSHPQHPYTQALLECVPRLGVKKDRLVTIDYAAIDAGR